MSTPSNQTCNSRELDRISGIASRGFGIHLDAARLMVMQFIGSIAGRTLVTRSVGGIVCAPGFDLAIIGGRRRMIHGAQMALLDGVLGEYQEARDREASGGREHTRHRYASLITKNTELQAQRKGAEERLRKLLHVPVTMEEMQACQGVHKTIIERKIERGMIEASIQSLTEEVIAVQGELADWKFASAPGIVLDDGSWLDFPGAAVDSFDGNFLQLASAGSLSQDYETLPPKWFRESMELLRRSRQESPFSVTARSRETTTCSMQITGDPFAFSRLFHDPKFARPGFFSGFLLVEADDENASCDPDAMTQITGDESWRIFLTEMLKNRLCDIRHRLHLDREGGQCCLDFQSWYWSFVTDLPDQHRWSFSGWPPLLVELAMGLAILEGQAAGEILEAGFLRSAGEMLRAHAPRQAALLQSLQPEAEVDDQFEERIDRIVHRLATEGPMTRRDLARTISGNDYGVIDALLTEAGRRGLIIQRGRQFAAAGVNVNASTGERVIDFHEGGRGMKLNRFLKRQNPGFRQHSFPGAVGGRSTLLYHFGDDALRPYKGPLSRQRLILMGIGSVEMQRDGRTYLAEEGDALLVPAGECELTFLQCPQSRGVQAEILEFDHRTIAPRLRNSQKWETLAFTIDDPAMGAIPLAGMVKAIDALVAHQVPARLRFPLIMAEVFGQFRRGLPQFLREHFYLPRWRLFVLLERHVLKADGVARLGAEYPGGAKQLRKDCRVYLGAEPGAIIDRRRCDLATAWLRCGHSIDDVGQALGFSSRWEFESVYAGRMRRRCAEVQAMPPLADAEPEELAAAMQPFWWPESWPTRVRIPRKKRSGRSGFLSEMDGEEIADVDGSSVDAGPAGSSDSADDLSSRRAKAADELRGNAKDYLAMKSTGAEIVVPIFGQREMIDLLAA